MCALRAYGSHCAAQSSSSADVVMLLLTQGDAQAQIEATDANGMTPLCVRIWF